MKIPHFYHPSLNNGPNVHKASTINKLVDLSLNPDELEGAKRDLAAFPVAWLKRMADDGIDVVDLKLGQNLAQTEVVPSLDNSSLKAAIGEGQDIIARELTKDPAYTSAPQSMSDIMANRALAESLNQSFSAAGLGFLAVASRRDLDIGSIASDYAQKPSELSDFERFFALLNKELVEIEEGQVKAQHPGVYVVPFSSTESGKKYPQSVNSYSQIHGQFADSHGGGHFPDQRLVVISHGATQLPAKVPYGNYRVLIHEMGHVMDHTIRGLSPEIRETHLRQLDSLFSAAHERGRQNPQDAFLTSRARDSREEYFAEGVEAYLTQAGDEKFETYKENNSRENLRRIDPDLFGYIDKLMRLESPVFRQALEEQ